MEEEADRRKEMTETTESFVSALMKLWVTEGNFSANDIQREAGIPETQM